MPRSGSATARHDCPNAGDRSHSAADTARWRRIARSRTAGIPRARPDDRTNRRCPLLAAPALHSAGAWPRPPCRPDPGARWSTAGGAGCRRHTGQRCRRARRRRRSTRRSRLRSRALFAGRCEIGLEQGPVGCHHPADERRDRPILVDGPVGGRCHPNPVALEPGENRDRRVQEARRKADQPLEVRRP